MIKISVTINRPVDVVWDYYTEVSNWSKWYGGGLKEVVPGWQNGAELIWELGRPSFIKKIIVGKEVLLASTWTEMTFRFKSSGKSATILEFIESDPKGGASYTDGGIGAKKEWEACLNKLKRCIESETAGENSPASGFNQPQLQNERMRQGNSSFGGYVQLNTLANVVRILFILTAVMSVISIISDYSQLNLLSHPFTSTQAEANDSRQSLVSSTYLLVYIATYIAFLVWINKSNKNLRALGTEGMQFTPGWAVGWFFVPLANLIYPYMVVTELYLASGSRNNQGDSWKASPSSPNIGWWWGALLIASFLNQISARMMMNANSASALSTATTIDIISSVVAIVEVLLAITLVREITARQEERHRLQSEQGSGFQGTYVLEGNINKWNETGSCPLHLSVACGDMEGVKDLLAKGADVNIQNQWGATPLDLALSNGHQYIAQLLHDMGGVTNNWKA